MILSTLLLVKIRRVAEFVYVPDAPEYSGFKERVYHDGSLLGEKISVNVLLLDTFVNTLNAIRFIKIDAEGGEMTILRSGDKLINKFLPVVSFESGDSSLINYPYCAADYFDFFSRHNYTIFSIFGI